MTEAAAAPVSMTTAAEPDGAPRVAGLDILRGIAILGILFMNINDMGASLFANGSFAPLLGWTLPDRIAWFLRETLADGTARGMLEMLFGAGMAILTDRAAIALGAAAERPTGWFAVALRTLFGPWPLLRGYAWRNIVLLGFGLVHLFILLWPGDILHTYGVAAIVAVLFRRLGPRTLITLGLLMSALQLIGQGSGLYAIEQSIARGTRLEQRVAEGGQLTPVERKSLAKFEKLKTRRATQRAGIASQIAAEDQARSAATGNASQWMRSAWRTTLGFWAIGDDAVLLEPFWIWEAARTMLIGAALFRWGIIQGRRSRRFYAWMLVLGYAIGLSGRVWRALVEMRLDDYPSLAYATGEATRLATTVGHLALVWLLLGTARGARLLQPFAAAGRSALSLYIAQTLICLWVLFPPFMFGLYGRLSWWQLMVTAAAIDAALLVGANWYMRRWSIAPVEWAWRSIVVGQRLPLRRLVAR